MKTDLQKSMTKDVQRVAYDRVPETCDNLKEIIQEELTELINDLVLDPDAIARVEVTEGNLFRTIRDSITLPFRDEQMLILDTLRREDFELTEIPDE